MKRITLAVAAGLIIVSLGVPAAAPASTASSTPADANFAAPLQNQLVHELRMSLDSPRGRKLLAAAREERLDGDPYDFANAAGWAPIIAASGQNDPDTLIMVLEAVKSSQGPSDDLRVKLIRSAILSDPGVAPGFFRPGEPGSGAHTQGLISESLRDDTVNMRTTIDEADADPLSKEAAGALRTAIQSLFPNENVRR